MQPTSIRAFAGLGLLLGVFFGVGQADEPPAAAPLHFDWPVPGKVRVTEKILRQGKTATTRYTVAVSRVEGADTLRVHMSDFEVVELLGHPADDPQVAPYVALYRAVSAAVPDLLVAKDGKLAGLDALDAAIGAAFADLESRASDAEKAKIARSRAELAKPEARELMTRQAHGFWDAWVGDWAGVTLTDGAPVTTTHALRGPDGTAYDAPTNLTRAKGENGAAVLSRDSALDEKQSRAALVAYVHKIAEVTGRSPPDGLFVGLDVAERVRTTTDPATLRPSSVVLETKTTLHLKDKPDEDKPERHEYTFAW